MLKTRRLLNVLTILGTLLFMLPAGHAFILIIKNEEGVSLGMSILTLSLFLLLIVGILTSNLEFYAKNRHEQKIRHFILKGLDDIDLKSQLNTIQKEEKQIQAKIDELDLFIQYEQVEDPKNMEAKRQKLNNTLLDLLTVKSFYLTKRPR